MASALPWKCRSKASAESEEDGVRMKELEAGGDDEDVVAKRGALKGGTERGPGTPPGPAQS